MELAEMLGIPIPEPESELAEELERLDADSPQDVPNTPLQKMESFSRGFGEAPAGYPLIREMIELHR